MLLRIFFVFSCFALFVMPSSSVYAQTGPADTAEMSEEEAKQRELAKAQAEALQNRVNGVMKRLDQAEMAHFLVMYTNYNLYSLVKAVRHDVSNAVKGCSDNNPSMADDLNNKFENWEKNVGQSMKEVDANIKSLGLAQDYISQNELNVLYGLVDETRAKNSSQFEKTPVTTSEACEFMMSKMDETQDNMTKLLAATLQSYPNMVKKTQE